MSYTLFPVLSRNYCFYRPCEELSKWGLNAGHVGTITWSIYMYASLLFPVYYYDRRQMVGLGYEIVYLPLCGVADTLFHIQIEYLCNFLQLESHTHSLLFTSLLPAYSTDTMDNQVYINYLSSSRLIVVDFYPCI